jgi:hypothetical protein
MALAFSEHLSLVPAHDREQKRRPANVHRKRQILPVVNLE